jgi:DNA replication protein DnaC
VTAAVPPALPADLNDGLKRLKMAAMRRLAPELLITAKTQRWQPEEFLRMLVKAEIVARDASNARTRMRAAAFPVVLVDELGFAPLDDTGAQLLVRIVAAAYERRSLGIGSHWPFESWERFLPEHTTAVSMLDRLLHHCHTVITDGDSYRMKQARAKGGTRPRPAESTAKSGDFQMATSGDHELAVDRSPARRTRLHLPAATSQPSLSSR